MHLVGISNCDWNALRRWRANWRLSRKQWWADVLWYRRAWRMHAFTRETRLQGTPVAVSTETVCYRVILPAYTAIWHGLLRRRHLLPYAQFDWRSRWPRAVYTVQRLRKSVRILPKGSTLSVLRSVISQVSMVGVESLCMLRSTSFFFLVWGLGTSLQKISEI